MRFGAVALAALLAAPAVVSGAAPATNPNAMDMDDEEGVQLFRRMQSSSESCDTNDWEGRKVIARNGKAYSIGASSMRASRQIARGRAT